MEKLFIGLVIILVIIVIVMLTHIPLPKDSRTTVATQRVVDAAAERNRVQQEQEEKSKRIIAMLDEATLMDITAEEIVDYKFLKWSDWPEVHEAVSNVMYSYYCDYGIDDPKYIWKDGKYYRMNLVPSEAEKRKILYAKSLADYRKKSKNLYKWRNARHLRRH